MNNSTPAWLLLAGSVAAEVAGTLALRYTDGFTRPAPSIAVSVCYALAIWLMSIAVKHLELGLAYSIWAGSGTALTCMLGMLMFGEAATLLRVLGLTLIVLGIVTLHLSAY